MKQMKVIIYFLALALVAVSFASCSDGKKSESSGAATVDEAQTVAEKSLTDDKDDYYEFNLQLSARDGNYIYTCDDIYEDDIDSYEINGNSSQLPFAGCRICVDDDIIYYVQTTTDENEEETWELYSYSKSSKDTTFYLEVQKWTVFLLRRNNIIYYQEGEQINSYDIISHKKDTLLKDNIVSSYAAESRIYYLSNAQTDKDYNDNGILKYYDINSKKSGVLLNENININNIKKRFECFLLDDRQRKPSAICSYIYNECEKNTIDPVKEINTKGELSFVACYSNILVYQEFDYQTGKYSTSALLLTDGKIQTDKNANLQFIGMNSHYVGNDDICVLKDESDHKDYFFDTNSGKVKKVTNSDDDRYATYYYCDGEVCMYKALGDNERSVAETLKLSDKLPSKEDAKTNGIESSPDGEYVHVKMYVPNTSGYISPVPELTIDSDDARKTIQS